MQRTPQHILQHTLQHSNWICPLSHLFHADGRRAKVTIDSPERLSSGTVSCAFVLNNESGFRLLKEKTENRSNRRAVAESHGRVFMIENWQWVYQGWGGYYSIKRLEIRPRPPKINASLSEVDRRKPTSGRVSFQAWLLTFSGFQMQQEGFPLLVFNNNALKRTPHWETPPPVGGVFLSFFLG